MNQLPTETCSFVKASDLTKGIAEDTIEYVSETLGRYITWGDANRTLIDVETYRQAVVDTDRGRLRSKQALIRRIDDRCLDATYVDLEN